MVGSCPERPPPDLPTAGVLFNYDDQKPRGLPFGSTLSRQCVVGASFAIGPS